MAVHMSASTLKQKIVLAPVNDDKENHLFQTNEIIQFCF
jgi:hypothetical protein